MGKPATLTAVCDVASVYVFGSRAAQDVGRDLDVLFVYDSKRCPPESAYNAISGVVRSLFHMFSVRIHFVVLTQEEQEAIGFIESEGCLPIAEWMARNRLHATTDSARNAPPVGR